MRGAQAALACMGEAGRHTGAGMMPLPASGHKRRLQSMPLLPLRMQHAVCAPPVKATRRLQSAGGSPKQAVAGVAASNPQTLPSPAASCRKVRPAAADCGCWLGPAAAAQHTAVRSTASSPQVKSLPAVRAENWPGTGAHVASAPADRQTGGGMALITAASNVGPACRARARLRRRLAWCCAQRCAVCQQAAYMLVTSRHCSKRCVCWQGHGCGQPRVVCSAKGRAPVQQLQCRSRCRLPRRRRCLQRQEEGRRQGGPAAHAAQELVLWLWVAAAGSCCAARGRGGGAGEPNSPRTP